MVTILILTYLPITPNEAYACQVCIQNTYIVIPFMLAEYTVYGVPMVVG